MQEGTHTQNQEAIEEKIAVHSFVPRTQQRSGNEDHLLSSSTERDKIDYWIFLSQIDNGSLDKQRTVKKP